MLSRKEQFKKFFSLLLLWMIICAVVEFSVTMQIKNKRMPKSENNIYGLTTQSVVEDGDLNIINNAPKEMTWLVSSTKNHPDIHDWGSVTIWAPFYFYAKILTRLGLYPEDCHLDNYETAQVMATVFFAVIFIILAWFILKSFSLNRNFTAIIATSFFGTSFWWFAIMEPSANEVISSVIFELLILFFISSVKNNYPAKWYGILGALFALLISFKFESFIYPMIFFIYLFYEEDKFNEKMKKLFCFVLGFVIIFLIDKGTLWMRWGFIDLPQLFILKHQAQFISNRFAILKGLFGPSGLIFLSPVYLFSMIGIIQALASSDNFGLSKKEIAILRSIFGVFLIQFCLSFFHSFGGKDFVGRQFIFQQIIFILGLSLFFNNLKLSYISKKIYYLLFSAISVWSLFWLFLYYTDQSNFGFFYPLIDAQQIYFISEIWAMGLSSMSDFYLRELFNASVFWFPFYCGFIVWIYCVFNIEKKKYFSALKTTSITVLFLFFTVAALNLINNSSNVEKLKSEGFFNNKVVGSGIGIYSYLNLNSHYRQIEKFAKINGKSKQLNDVQLAIRDLYQRTRLDIASDPTDFLSISFEKWLSLWNDVDDLSKEVRSPSCKGIDY